MRRLLAADRDDDERRDAGLPGLARVDDRGEAEAALVALRATLQPSDRAVIITILTRLAAHFWDGHRDEQHWRIVFEDYADDLAAMPADIIQQGAVEFRRAGKWWPKSAELLEIMRPLLARRERDIRRLERLAADRSNGGPEEIDIEERKRVGEKLGQLRAQLAADRPFRRISELRPLHVVRTMEERLASLGIGEAES